MTAHEVLREAVRTTAVRASTPPPCMVITTPLWLSDIDDERARAAELCAGCPVLHPCRDAGATERFGVWGGLDAGLLRAAQPDREETP